MKLLTVLLAWFASTASLPAAGFLFLSTLDGTQIVPPNASRGGGGAILSVQLDTRAWSLTGAISNLVSGATSAGIFGPAPVGQNADLLFPLSYNAEPEGPLGGAGVLSPDELGWLQAGLLYVNIPTDQYPDGEIRGQLALVPEPWANALVAGLALFGFGTCRTYCSRRRIVGRPDNSGHSG